MVDDLTRWREIATAVWPSGPACRAALRQAADEVEQLCASLDAHRKVEQKLRQYRDEYRQRAEQAEAERDALKAALREWATVLARGTGNVPAVDVAWKLRQLAGDQAQLDEAARILAALDALATPTPTEETGDTP